MVEYDKPYKVYKNAKSVQSAKSQFAEEYSVPYSECKASKVDWAACVVAVIHCG